MQPLSANDAKYGSGRLIDLARAESVADAKHGREDRIMDQAIHSEIATFICGIEAKLSSRSHFAPGSRMLSADAKKSESPRWR
ncbi:MAG: hypothetical protein KF769_10405 [Parvibaculum sp.]|nr:hypothetical protein [Parvibaculum sp.]